MSMLVNSEKQEYNSVEQMGEVSTKYSRFFLLDVILFLNFTEVVINIVQDSIFWIMYFISFAYIV